MHKEIAIPVDNKTKNKPNVAVLKSGKKRDDKWSLLLIEVGQDRSRKAFMALFKHFAPLLKSFAQANRHQGTLPGMAEDLVQEVMIKVWQKAQGLTQKKRQLLLGSTQWHETAELTCYVVSQILTFTT